MGVHRNGTAYFAIIGAERMKLTRNVGMLLLGIWLIVSGLVALLGLSFHGLPLLMGILALVAGILIVIGR